MTKKILCKITDNEVNEYLLILQNISTYDTLLFIKRENHNLTQNDCENIFFLKKQRYKDYYKWWQKITLKYTIPYFKNENMYLDPQRNEIYLNLDLKR